MTLIEKFNQERDTALLSMDENKIRDFHRKWNEHELPTGQVFWAAVHKAITGATSLPIEFRRISKKWLNDHELQSHDDGDL